MHPNWNLTRVLAASIAALCTTTAYAMPKGPCEGGSCSKGPYESIPEERNEHAMCSEPAPGPFGFAYPVDINLACPRDFYAHADALLMQAKEDGLEFAITENYASTNVINNGTLYGFSGNTRDYHYNPGIRIGCGFNLDHDAWNIDFNWTWLNITNRRSINPGSSGDSIIPLLLVPSTDMPSATTDQGVSAVWNAHYDTFDVRLGKPFYVSRYLTLNPHFGLRGGWIDQHFSAHYGNVTTHTATHDIVTDVENDFWGVGSRVGIDSEWILGKGWNLFANFAGSFLFGKFDVTQSVTYTLDVANGYDVDDTHYQNVMNYELALGLGWTQYFSKDRYRVGLRLAYEFQNWADQNQLRRFFGNNTVSGTFPNDTTARGDLTLNGFSLRAQFDI